MKFRHLALCATASLTLFAAGAAQATDIKVVTWIAPNSFGSPSYAGAVANAIGALHDGASSRGAANQPTYFEARSDVARSDVVVTGFNSWNGKVDPGNVYGSQYAAELGNRMLFGLRIDGEGTQFAINQLSFVMASNDATNDLGYTYAAGAYSYSNDYQGVLKGGDGILWTSDDVFVNSGASNQLVDGLVGRGSGNSYAAYCPGCTLEQQQAALDDVINYDGWPTQFTGTYTLGSATGTGTFNIAAVPEPATWAMMIAGFGLVGGSLRSRRNLPVRALA